jgi:hypothetical protein
MNITTKVINDACAVSKVCDPRDLVCVERTARSLGYTALADIVAQDLDQKHYGDDSQYFSILKQHLFGASK